MAEKRKISLVLADVDGTLVTQEKVLTERAQAAVRGLRKAGIRFAITSGRPPRGMAMLIEPLALTTPIGGFNGAIFVHRDMTVLEEHVFAIECAAEAIEIIFDPEQISYRDLLEFFFQIHDPTTKNRQGNDVGDSYRSAIFYTTDEQRKVAEDTIADVDASGLWPGKVVTEVTPAGPFWEAEPEHQDYLERYPNGYTCHFVRPNWKLPRRAGSVAT